MAKWGRIVVGFLGQRGSTNMPKSVTPHYRRIMNEIREQIDDGRLPPGSRLPSTAELAAQYDVHIGTVKLAVRLLIESGVLRGHPGVGVFVVEKLG